MRLLPDRVRPRGEYRRPRPLADGQRNDGAAAAPAPRSSRPSPRRTGRQLRGSRGAGSRALPAAVLQSYDKRHSDERKARTRRPSSSATSNGPFPSRSSGPPSSGASTRGKPAPSRSWRGASAENGAMRHRGLSRLCRARSVALRPRTATPAASGMRAEIRQRSRQRGLAPSAGKSLARRRAPWVRSSPVPRRGLCRAMANTPRAPSHGYCDSILQRQGRARDRRRPRLRPPRPDVRRLRRGGGCRRNGAAQGS
jgi:hypothetical protein